MVILKLTILELYSDKDLEVYKCIKPVVPRAKNAVFKESTTVTGQFDFLDYENDTKRPEDETGYVATAGGDSGSPYWITEPVNGEIKATLVAVNSWGSLEFLGNEEAKSAYLNNPYYQCSIGATKITDDIRLWIDETYKKWITPA